MPLHPIGHLRGQCPDQVQSGDKPFILFHHCLFTVATGWDLFYVAILFIKRHSLLPFDNGR